MIGGVVVFFFLFSVAAVAALSPLPGFTPATSYQADANSFKQHISGCNLVVSGQILDMCLAPHKYMGPWPDSDFLIRQTRATKVSAGAGGLVCAIFGYQPNKDVVRCWGNAAGAVGLEGFSGYGKDKQFINASTEAYVLDWASYAKVDDIAVGLYHVCMLANQNVRCWGSDSWGQLGDAEPGVGGIFEDIPSLMAPIRDPYDTPLSVQVLSCGPLHCCAISGYAAICWGRNTHGELGIDSTVSLTPYWNWQYVGIDPFEPLDQVSCGHDHTCVRTQGGRKLKCWGSNSHGQLGIPLGSSAGDGTDLTVAQLDYVAFANTNELYRISAGNAVTCVIFSFGGQATCFGKNEFGEAGQDTAAAVVLAADAVDIPPPVGYTGDNAVMWDITAGDGYVCGVYANIAFRCWGRLVAGPPSRSYIPGQPVSVGYVPWVQDITSSKPAVIIGRAPGDMAALDILLPPLATVTYVAITLDVSEFLIAKSGFPPLWFFNDTVLPLRILSDGIPEYFYDDLSLRLVCDPLQVRAGMSPANLTFAFDLISSEIFITTDIMGPFNCNHYSLVLNFRNSLTPSYPSYSINLDPQYDIWIVRKPLFNTNFLLAFNLGASAIHNINSQSPRISYLIVNQDFSDLQLVRVNDLGMPYPYPAQFSFLICVSREVYNAYYDRNETLSSVFVARPVNNSFFEIFSNKGYFFDSDHVSGFSGDDTPIINMEYSVSWLRDSGKCSRAPASTGHAIFYNMLREVVTGPAMWIDTEGRYSKGYVFTITGHGALGPAGFTRQARATLYTTNSDGSNEQNFIFRDAVAKQLNASTIQVTLNFSSVPKLFIDIPVKMVAISLVDLNAYFQVSLPSSSTIAPVTIYSSQELDFLQISPQALPASVQRSAFSAPFAIWASSLPKTNTSWVRLRPVASGTAAQQSPLQIPASRCDSLAQCNTLYGTQLTWPAGGQAPFYVFNISAIPPSLVGRINVDFSFDNGINYIPHPKLYVIFFTVTQIRPVSAPAAKAATSAASLITFTGGPFDGSVTQTVCLATLLNPDNSVNNATETRFAATVSSATNVVCALFGLDVGKYVLGLSQDGAVNRDTSQQLLIFKVPDIASVFPSYLPSQSSSSSVNASVTIVGSPVGTDLTFAQIAATSSGLSASLVGEASQAGPCELPDSVAAPSTLLCNLPLPSFLVPGTYPLYISLNGGAAYSLTRANITIYSTSLIMWDLVPLVAADPSFAARAVSVRGVQFPPAQLFPPGTAAGPLCYYYRMRNETSGEFDNFTSPYITSGTLVSASASTSASASASVSSPSALCAVPTPASLAPLGSGVFLLALAGFGRSSPLYVPAGGIVHLFDFPAVASLSPTWGPSSGGTTISIVLAFPVNRTDVNATRDRIVPFCAIGSIVPFAGIWDPSTSTVKCTTPRLVAGSLAIRLSLNSGYDFVSLNQTFASLDPTTVFPTWASSQGGAKLVVAFSSTITSFFNTATSSSPLSSFAMSCLFSSTTGIRLATAPLALESARAASCITPAQLPVGRVRLGVLFTSTSASASTSAAPIYLPDSSVTNSSFTVHPAVSITRVTPLSGPGDGGSVITLYFSNTTSASSSSLFAAMLATEAALAGDGSALDLATGGRPDCVFATRTGDSISSLSLAQATLDASTLTVKCIAPAGQGAVSVGISANVGVESAFAASGIVFTYFKIISIEPKRGPVSGSTQITIFGVGFVASGVFSCRFGSSGIIVPAIRVQDTMMLCTAPSSRTAQNAHTFNAQALLGSNTISLSSDGITFSQQDTTSSAGAADSTFQYYDTPTVTAVSPGSGHTSGGYQVTVYGTQFLSGAVVRIGAATVLSQVTVQSSSVANFSMAVGSPGRASVAISNNAADYSSTSGAAASFVFTQCAPGYYAESDTDPCKACPAGKFSARNGSQECTSCGITAYSVAAGSPACTPCTPNSRIEDAVPDSKAKCLCISGTFFNATDETCIDCPLGAVCDGKLASPKAQVGFWADPEAPLQFLSCADIACPGGDPGECPEGSTGRLCSLCLDGYYKYGSGCAKCPRHAKLLFAGFLIFLVIIVLIFLKSVGADTGRRYAGTISVAMDFLQVLGIINNLNLNWPFTLQSALRRFTSIAFFSADIVASECTYPAIKWPEKWAGQMSIPLLVSAILAILWLLAFLQSRLLSLRASKSIKKAKHNRDSSQSAESIVSTISSESESETDESSETSYSDDDDDYEDDDDRNRKDSNRSRNRSRSGGASGFLIWISRGIKRTMRALSRPMDMNHVRNRVVNSFFLFFELFYMYLVALTFSFFNCAHLEDSKYTLMADKSLLCSDSWWKNLLPYGIVGLAVYVAGIPLLTAGLLWLRRDHLRQPFFSARYSSLYADFKIEYPFWGTVDKIEKVAFAALATFASKWPTLQAIAVIFVLLATLLIQISFAPMFDPRDNSLDALLRFCTVIVMVAGLIFDSGSVRSEQARDFLVVVVLAVVVIASIAIIGAVLSTLLFIYRDGKRKVPGKLEDLISEVFCPTGAEMLLQRIKEPGTALTRRVCRTQILPLMQKLSHVIGVGSKPGGSIDVASDEDSLLDTYTSQCFPPIALPRVREYLLEMIDIVRSKSHRAGADPALRYEALVFLCDFHDLFNDMARYTQLRNSNSVWIPSRQSSSAKHAPADAASDKLSHEFRNAAALVAPFRKSPLSQEIIEQITVLHRRKTELMQLFSAAERVHIATKQSK